MSVAWSCPAGATTIAAAPSPKIMREGRTLPILSENFSAQTTRTGRSTSCRRRAASARPYGSPAQTATTSAELCVWYIPSSGQPGGHRRHHPGAGAGADDDRPDLLRLPAGVGECGLRCLQGDVLQIPLGVEPLPDPGLRADLLHAHRRPVVRGVADQVLVGA